MRHALISCGNWVYRASGTVSVIVLRVGEFDLAIPRPNTIILGRCISSEICFSNGDHLDLRSEITAFMLGQNLNCWHTELIRRFIIIISNYAFRPGPTK